MAASLGALVGLLAVPASAFGPFPVVPLHRVDADARDTERAPPAGTVIRARSTAKLADMFASIDYRLEGVRRRGTVPRLMVASLPGDLPDLQVPTARKRLFIRLALPLVLMVNESIERDRARIIRLRARQRAGVPVAARDRRWLDGMFADYGVDRSDFATLLRRVDVIPPSLALAQSAEESGWGTSRYAREGNALFGQRIFKGKAGIVPARRPEGERFRVRAFDKLLDGVRAYAMNLNAHPAYADFRAARAAIRAAGRIPGGPELIGHLEGYSERRGAYVETIRTIIEANGLTVFDTARLGDEVPRFVPSPET